jgi:hypothetical protein
VMPRAVGGRDGGRDSFSRAHRQVLAERPCRVIITTEPAPKPTSSVGVPVPV